MPPKEWNQARGRRNRLACPLKGRCKLGRPFPPSIKPKTIALNIKADAAQRPRHMRQNLLVAPAPPVNKRGLGRFGSIPRVTRERDRQPRHQKRTQVWRKPKRIVGLYRADFCGAQPRLDGYLMVFQQC
ncbi:hypothetical protein Hgul01_05253 [Herpetosiphon gulosus]|uniref:Uncharacterized protein n=1 Tax=Herpetosiphon gulosus TaxID=1973496 RepID=A0ABP9XA35_9CHLR